MLGQAIGNLLPSAIGVALSPIPIIAVILMLATPRAKSNGLLFTLGWVGGLVAVSVVVLLVTGDASNPNGTNSQVVSWIKIAFGALFVLMSNKQWRARPRHGEVAVMPKWMATIDAFTPAKSTGFGVVLSALNPKNLALTLAAAASIAQADLSTGGSAAAVGVFVVLGSITVAGPVVFYLFAPRAAAKPLNAVKEFMSEHNAVIMFVLLLVLGAKLIGDGLGGVTT
jgi:threonine/homoserine/homoserine lactone efflux protein